MTEQQKLLQNTFLFRSLSEETVEHELLPHSLHLQYPKNRFLLEPQQELEHFGVVLSGRIHVYHLFPDGATSLTKVLTPGQIWGADLLFTHSRLAPYHAQAALPAEILAFPADLLQPGLLSEQTRSELIERLLVLVSQENMKKEYRLAILSQKGLRERVLTYLTMQAGRRGTDSFTIPFSREELASFLCVNRSALSHELGKMRQEGLIDFRKNSFTLFPGDH